MGEVKRKEYTGNITVKDVYSKKALEDQMPLNAEKKYSVEFGVYGKVDGVNTKIPFEKCMDVMEKYKKGEISEGMFPAKVVRPVVTLTKCREGEEPKGWDKADDYFDNVTSYACQAYDFNEYPDKIELTDVSYINALEEKIPFGARSMYNIEREVLCEDGTVIPLVRCREELRSLEDKEVEEDMFPSRIVKPLITLTKCKDGEEPKGWDNLESDFRCIQEYADESWYKGYDWLVGKDRISLAGIESIEDIDDFMKKNMPPEAKEVYSVKCIGTDTSYNYDYKEVISDRSGVHAFLTRCDVGEEPTGWGTISDDIKEMIDLSELEYDDYDDYDYDDR